MNKFRINCGLLFTKLEIYSFKNQSIFAESKSFNKKKGFFLLNEAIKYSFFNILN